MGGNTGVQIVENKTHINQKLIRDLNIPITGSNYSNLHKRENYRFYCIGVNDGFPTFRYYNQFTLLDSMLCILQITCIILFAKILIDILTNYVSFCKKKTTE